MGSSNISMPGFFCFQRCALPSRCEIIPLPSESSVRKYMDSDNMPASLLLLRIRAHRAMFTECFPYLKNRCKTFDVEPLGLRFQNPIETWSCPVLCPTIEKHTSANNPRFVIVFSKLLYRI